MLRNIWCFSCLDNSLCNHCYHSSPNMIDNHGIAYEFFLMSREVEVGSRVKYVVESSAYRIEGKSLVVLQVNCTSVCCKAL
jgi:hypothetical protein